MTEHKTLAEALVAFQAEAPKLLKDSTANAGSFKYKYVDLAAVMDKIQPLLAEHGLAWVAFPCYGPNDEPALKYGLTHTSGELLSDKMPLMVQKPDPQGLGSAITYARRYALTAVLNLVADEDDDGAKASKPAPAKPLTSPAFVPNPHEQGQIRQVSYSGGEPAKPLVSDQTAFIQAAAKGLTMKQIRGCLESQGLDSTHVDMEPPFSQVPTDKSGALIAALKGIMR